jgi:hypothetical protein
LQDTEYDALAKEHDELAKQYELHPTGHDQKHPKMGPTASIGSLAKAYGAITFILEHPPEIEAYLGDQDRRWEPAVGRIPVCHNDPEEKT